MKRKKLKFPLLALLGLLILVGLVWLVLNPAPIVQRPVYKSLVEEIKPPAVDKAADTAGLQQTPSVVPEPVKPSIIVPPPAAPMPAKVEPKKIPGTGQIAIIIDDMGLNIAGSARAVKLPASVTLSYMPYAPKLAEQTDAAKAAGHELMLHMPMQPMGHDNPGPDALWVGLSPEEITARLNRSLDKFSGYDGINNHMGSKFTADADGMALVVGVLKQRGLFFLDSRTSPKSVGAKVAAEQGLPHAQRDVFLDDDMSSAAVLKQLDETERVARKQGHVIAIGHPHPETLKALEQWLPKMQQLGFQLVSVHDLVR